MNIVRLDTSVKFPGNLLDFGPKEELAFAVASAMLPPLLDWKKKREITAAELQATERKYKELQAQAQSLDAALKAEKSKGANQESVVDSARRDVEAVEAKPWKIFRFLYMLFFGKKYRQEHAEAAEVLDRGQRALEQLRGNLDSVERQLKSCQAELRQTVDRAAALTKRSADLKALPQVLEAIRSFDYPLIPLVVQEGKVDKRPGVKPKPRVSVFVDVNGPLAPIELPHLSLSDKDVDEMVDLLNKINSDSIMLDAGEKKNTFGSWGNLYGSEVEIERASHLLSELTSNYQAREFNISIIQKSSALGEYIQAALGEEAKLETAFADIDRLTKQRLVQLSTDAGKIQELLDSKAGQHPDLDNSLARLSELFSSKLFEMKDLREKSHAGTDRGLRKAIENSYLTRYHYFCPQCNATPGYIKNVLKIDDTDLENLNSNKVRAGLQKFWSTVQNGKIGKTFSTDDLKRFDAAWKDAFSYLERLDFLFREAQAEREASLQEDHQDSGYAKRIMWRLQNDFETTIRSLLKNPFMEWKEPLAMRDDSFEFEAAARKKVEILNPNSKLQFDPDSRGLNWECPLCGETYQFDQIKQGAVDKLRHDVVYPMINRLWEDEALWSKKVDLIKDIHREYRDRQVEESNALNSPINHFLDDTRQVRLQLNNAFALGESTALRLNQIAEEFSSRGLLEDHELQDILRWARETKEKIAYVQEKIERADEKENEIKDVPQLVFRDRQIPPFPEYALLEKDAQRNLLMIPRQTEPGHEQ